MMGPPDPRPCPVPGCKYRTPDGCPTWELVYEDLKLHTKYGHPDQGDGPSCQPTMSSSSTTALKENSNTFPMEYRLVGLICPKCQHDLRGERARELIVEHFKVETKLPVFSLFYILSGMPR